MTFIAPIFYIFCILSPFSISISASDLWSSIEDDLERSEYQLEEPEETTKFDSYIHLTDLEEYPNICDEYDNENCAKAWLEEFDIIKRRNSNRMSNVNYRFNADINTENGRLKMKFQHRNIGIFKKMKEKVIKFEWRKFKCPQTRRIFKLLTPTTESQNKTISELLLNITYQISEIYNHGHPCYGFCLNEGEPAIIELFRNDRDYDKLAGFWSSWRNETGRKIKGLFIERMRLENIEASENGYPDSVSYYLSHDYEETNFNETIMRLYDEILPLYEQLHAYVRYCLSKFYPNKFDKNGPIPAHILGNVWAQQWQNIQPIIENCRVKMSTHSIQKEANKKLGAMSVKDMFRASDEFYQGIGLYKMTPKFWQRSVIKQPPNKLVNCHGSAYDFNNRDDFRIMMCTKKNLNYFQTIHHEMGHVEYYMAYRDLPTTFHGAANPGFHEAIGDTVGLSVMTPTHLKKIGLISDVPSTKDHEIDHLLATALEKVAFLPFALTMESYLWGLYNGSVPLDKLNEHWWKLRLRFQGLKAPFQRTELDFDAGAKYHIAFGRSYIRYFVSFILQFQFYESMCDLSGHIGPLHNCDFHNSKDSGERLLEMLKKGKSQHWRDTLKILTGTRDLTSRPLIRFFEPLHTWLKETNKKLNNPIGW